MNKVRAISRAMTRQSTWMNDHSVKVMKYAVAAGRALGLSEENIETLKLAGLLHDIGKIDTCSSVLDKRGGLTSNEFELVKKHPEHGANLLLQTDTLMGVAPVIRHHHERYDGTGYPDRLTGDGIPFLSRILYVADAFDSMTADRPYRKAPGKDYAISELRRCSGTQFDPMVVEAFLNVIEDFSSGENEQALGIPEEGPAAA